MMVLRFPDSSEESCSHCSGALPEVADIRDSILLKVIASCTADIEQVQGAGAEELNETGI
jgi:hypothetical protein